MMTESQNCGNCLSKMAYQTLQQEYLQIPVVTRAYTTACVLTTAAVVRKGRVVAAVVARLVRLLPGLLSGELPVV